MAVGAGTFAVRRFVQALRGLIHALGTVAWTRHQEKELGIVSTDPTDIDPVPTVQTVAPNIAATTNHVSHDVKPMDSKPVEAKAMDVKQAAELIGQALAQVQRVIVGQGHLVEQLMVGLLAKGHILLEGVPGTAKTLAVSTFAKVVGGRFARIQFTPDLVPSDIVGTRIYSMAKETFDVELGPVFVNFVLADEVNRAPAKVQAAMLEVMAEKQVSIGGTTYPMAKPFIVIATQNPVESEGVLPLP